MAELQLNSQDSIVLVMDPSDNATLTYTIYIHYVIFILK